MTGMPCTLIRLAGCPLRCHYCDTPASLPARSGKLMTIEAICAKVVMLSQPLILVTGGEPLAQTNTMALLEALLPLAQQRVQIETSGAWDISAIPTAVARIIDIKTPDSGEEARNRWHNLDLLRNGDEIKFVICSEADYRWSVNTIQRHGLDQRNIPLFISPAHGQVELLQVAEWMRRDQLPTRLQPQLHKWIWGAEATSV
ncbi:MAG: radical SAM protein [Mariprofundales bacterium]